MAWKPSPRVRAFLSAYAECADITASAKAAGIDRSAHYRLLERTPEYEAAFRQARQEIGDRLIALAHERVFIGTKKLILYHGKPVMVRRDPSKPYGKKVNPKVPHYEYEVSEGLHLALLKALKPELFRDRLSAELTGKDGGPINQKLEIVFVKSPPNAGE